MPEGLIRHFDYSPPFTLATYNHLPVYKVSYDLLVDLFRFVKDFRRDYKFTVGESMKHEAIEMIKNIYRANSSQQKQPLIQAARENTETIRLYLRLTHDLKQVNLETFVKLNERIESISKQLSAWHKACA